MLVRRAAGGALLTLAACAGGAPGSMCLFSCTVVIRQDSPGDTEVQQNRQIDEGTRHRAREWLERRKAGEATTAPPKP